MRRGLEGGDEHVSALSGLCPCGGNPLQPIFEGISSTIMWVCLGGGSMPPRRNQNKPENARKNYKKPEKAE